MKRLNRLLITRRDGRVFTALLKDRHVLQMNLEDKIGTSLLHNIYIGKVKNVAKNINAAFVAIHDGQMGYYSLAENKTHYYTDGRAEDSRLKAGDEIMVQVERDGVKTKDPVLTSHLNLTGRYSVLIAGKAGVSFSGKITNQSWKSDMRKLLEPLLDERFGIIIRTNAASVPPEDISAEILSLKQRFEQLLQDMPFRTCYSLLYEEEPPYIAAIRDTYTEQLEEIITDDVEIYRELSDYLTKYQPELLKLLKLYDDPMLSLNKLYSLDTALERATSPRVWLKSGAYLVIEPTEALVVIDVNTGKYTGHKNMRDTIKKINLEAAYEIGSQLRLRNLSGIIIVDFIDMEYQEDKDELMRTLDRIFKGDQVKTTLVDMTRLNLVEITRKKVRKPLHEQIR